MKREAGLQQEIGLAAQALRLARRVVVFTGAGISAESGIPTFRDALTGLWSRFDAAELATPEAFERDPALVWGWYEWRRRRALAAKPNPGHVAVAALAEHCAEFCLMTQNVDDLHERAGSREVIHLHGSLHQPRCSACGRAFDYESSSEPMGGGELSEGRLDPPACGDCGEPVRPGVVWFGEPLPSAALERAFAAAGDCDVLISVGTSGVVYPAAQVPIHARQSGAVVIEVNPQPIGVAATHFLAGPAGVILPKLVRLASADSAL